jgi:hypothetical protein
MKGRGSTAARSRASYTESPGRGSLNAPEPVVIIPSDDGRGRRVEVGIFGKMLKPYAHEWAKLLFFSAANTPSGEQVSLPYDLVYLVACLLMAQPRNQRGRPPKESTRDLERVLAQVGSKLGAARAVASKTGESVQNLRRRQRSKKPRKGDAIFSFR